jgi:hypothetical protein
VEAPASGRVPFASVPGRCWTFSYVNSWSVSDWNHLSWIPSGYFLSILRSKFQSILIYLYLYILYGNCRLLCFLGDSSRFVCWHLCGGLSNGMLCLTTLHNLHSQVSAWISFVKLPWTGMSPFLGRVGFGWHQISWRISTNLFASPKPA